MIEKKISSLNFHYRQFRVQLKICWLATKLILVLQTTIGVFKRIVLRLFLAKQNTKRRSSKPTRTFVRLLPLWVVQTEIVVSRACRGQASRRPNTPK